MYIFWLKKYVIPYFANSQISYLELEYVPLFKKLYACCSLSNKKTCIIFVKKKYVNPYFVKQSIQCYLELEYVS